MRAFFLILSLIITVHVYSSNTLPIIPQPKSITVKSGYFSLSQSIRISSNNSEFNTSIELFNQFLQSNYNIQLETVNKKSDIVIEQNDQLGEEGYSLVVSEKKINIKGNGAGIFYAFKTLEQLIKYDNGVFQIPACEIIDEPRFNYRGLMLDVGRYYYSTDYIKQFIDLMSHYKLNKFHWHLTEDQGWRIEIKQYPELTKKAVWRNSTQIHRDKTQDNVPHGGFYRQEEIKGIVQYAKDRMITVIPEIEMPGHSMAALSVYPELSCTGMIPTKNEWGIFPDIYCAGNDSTFIFLENVLSEVIELFPGEYIHIGGDEAPKRRWEQCPKCQQRINDEKLKGVHELQSYFVKRIEKFLNSKGRKIIGWDEILEGGLNTSATVMSWRGEKGGIAAAKAGHNVIMAPAEYLYLDYYQAKDRSIEPYCHGGNLPLSKVYNYEPYSSELASEEHKFIIGVQANLWTEYIHSESKANYMLFPRVLALSEIAWSDQKDKCYNSFTTRLPRRLHALEKKGVLFRIPEVQVSKDLLSDNSYKIILSSLVENSLIFFTTDGSNPSINGEIYQDGIIFDESSEQFLKYVIRLESGRDSAIFTLPKELKN